MVTRQISRREFLRLSAALSMTSVLPLSDIAGMPAFGQAPQRTPAPIPARASHDLRSRLAVESDLQAWSPGALGMAIAPDGKIAHLSYEQEDTVLVVDLAAFTVTHSIDVSAAGNMITSSAAALTPNGSKLYVSNLGTHNLMVINAENNSVEAVLPLRPKHAAAIAISPNGAKAYVVSDDGSMFIINTADNSYRCVSVSGAAFRCVTPSASDPNLVYAVGTLSNGLGITTPSFFSLNPTNGAIVHSASLSDPVLLDSSARVNRLVVDSSETRAYFGSFSFGTGNKGVGRLTIVDLNAFQVLTSTPIECGVSDLVVNVPTGKIYIIGLWSGGDAPGTLPIHEWDISTNAVVRDIPVSPSTDQRAIAVDPANSNYLYMTEGDFNLIRKVEIATGKEVGKVQFNRADIRPYAIIRYGNTGYIASLYSSKIYKLDLASGQLTGSFTLPYSGVTGWGFYHDRLYVSIYGTDTIYALHPVTGSLLATYHVGTPVHTIVSTFYGDRMATLDYVGAMVAKRLLIFNATTMTLLNAIDLPSDSYADKVIASPDGSKLYIIRGGMSGGGTATITIFDGLTLAVLNTIVVPPPSHLPAGGGASFNEGEFDETVRILYLIGHASVYKIDMDTDQLIGRLDVLDAYGPSGIRWSPTGLCGVTLSPSKDKLYVASLDSHSVFIYDLVQAMWETKITNLRGYFNTDSVSSADHQHFFVVNQQSDSVTMVNLASGDVEKIIDLGAYSRDLYLPIVLK